MSVQPLKRRAPKRGDIIEIDFSPSAGREMRERHPAAKPDEALTIACQVMGVEI